MQAAYKAVVAKKYSDIKHLNGGVYGEDRHLPLASHVWYFQGKAELHASR